MPKKEKNFLTYIGIGRNLKPSLIDVLEEVKQADICVELSQNTFLVFSIELGKVNFMLITQGKGRPGSHERILSNSRGTVGSSDNKFEWCTLVNCDNAT